MVGHCRSDIEGGLRRALRWHQWHQQHGRQQDRVIASRMIFPTPRILAGFQVRTVVGQGIRILIDLSVVTLFLSRREDCETLAHYTHKHKQKASKSKQAWTMADAAVTAHRPPLSPLHTLGTIKNSSSLNNDNGK